MNAPHNPNPSKILVFGATGGTGRHVIEHALAAGHHVTAFVRRAGALGPARPGLREVVGDVTEPAHVRQAVAGHDAVICAIGAPPSSRDKLRERGTRVIVGAMQQAGVRRLVCLSSHGIAESAQELPLLMRWVIVPLVLRRVFDDHEAQERVVHESGLDWTLVRPPHLSDRPGTGAIDHGLGRVTSMKIPREDVARFLVAQVTDDTYVCATPFVCAA